MRRHPRALVKKALHSDYDELEESDETASLPKQAEPTNPDADFEMDDGEGNARGSTGWRSRRRKPRIV